MGSHLGGAKMSKTKSFEYDEEKEREAEELVRKEQPELHFIMSSFKHLAEEREQEKPPTAKAEAKQVGFQVVNCET